MRTTKEEYLESRIRGLRAATKLAKDDENPLELAYTLCEAVREYNSWLKREYIEFNEETQRVRVNKKKLYNHVQTTLNFSRQTWLNYLSLGTILKRGNNGQYYLDKNEAKKYTTSTLKALLALLPRNVRKLTKGDIDNKIKRN